MRSCYDGQVKMRERTRLERSEGREGVDCMALWRSGKH